MRRLLLLIAAAILLAGATTPNSFVTPQTPNRGLVQFLQGTDVAGTYKTIYTAGTNGSRCYGMWMSNSDGSATHQMQIQIVNGGIKYGGVSLVTTNNAGFANTVPPQSLTSSAIWPGLPIDQYGNSYIQLISGDTIQATFATALTTSTFINIVVSCSDF